MFSHFSSYILSKKKKQIDGKVFSFLFFFIVKAVMI